MALSRNLALSSSLLLFAGNDFASAAYMAFPVYDSQDRPTEFKDGLMSYARLTRDYDETDEGKLEQFLLCTSCTISYMFGQRNDFFGSGKTEQMRFKAGGELVPVTFIDTNL